MMLVAGPVLRGLRDLADRAVGAGRVELGDVDEGDAGDQADDAGEEEPDPGGDAVGTRATGVHHDVGGDAQPHHGQGGRCPVPAVEDVHRVLVLLAADEERDGHDGGEEAEGAHHEREEDPRLGVRPAGVDRDRVDRDAQDHGADVLGGGGLEEVRAAAGAVADVVADEVRDHARVAGIVLGDALLHLADEVGADVRGLGVDAAAELGEQRHEAGAEAEADDDERCLGDADLLEHHLVEREDAPHAEERECDDEEAGDGATAHRDLHRLDEAAAGGRGGPHVGADADRHADDARGHRARRADKECECGQGTDREAGERGHIGDLLVLDQRDHHADDHRGDQRKDADRHVLALDEGVRALADDVAHVLHGLGALVTGEDVAREIEREEDRGDARDRYKPLERLGHQVLQSLLRRIRAAVRALATGRREPTGSLRRPGLPRQRWAMDDRGSERTGTAGSAMTSLCVRADGGQTGCVPERKASSG